MTDSSAEESIATAAARPHKRERLVAAARELIYRQGVARTTLADIAQEADVPLGNVYYYFKTKDDIVGAVVDNRAAQLVSTFAELERRHRRPRARLKALVAEFAERAEATAQFGCPYGTLSSELAKRAGGSDPLAAPLMQIQLDWVEDQLRGMGRRDAHDLAVELIAAYEGSTILASALGQPELMAQQSRRLQRWIDTLQT
jgi:TetR/AcrR family transcriptional regulator, transcriptional repressor for nem operon